MHPYPKIKTISGIVVKSKHLGALQGKAGQLMLLKNQILNSLKSPPPCDFTVSDFRQTVLTLNVDHSGFASRLRFMAPDWVQQLRQADPKFWQYLAQIKIKVTAKNTSKSIRLNGESNQLNHCDTSKGPQHHALSEHSTQRKKPSPVAEHLTQLNDDFLEVNDFTLTYGQATPSRPKSRRLRQLVYGSIFDIPTHKAETKRTTQTSSHPLQTSLVPQQIDSDIDEKLSESLNRLARHFI